MSTPAGTAQVESIIDVTIPNGGLVSFLVEARASVTPRDAQQLFSGIARRYRQLNPFGTSILVVAPWISTRTQNILVEEGINYIDLTGNARVEVASPALFLSHRGANRSPEPKPRGKARVRGPKAGRLIRLLVDVRPPYSVNQISSVAHLSPGYVSRLLDTLDEEALVERGRKGEVTATDVTGLLRRWVESYAVFGTNEARSFVAAKGPSELLQRIERVDKADTRLAVTGSFAAVRLAPVAAPSLLLAYAANIERTAHTLGLLPADRGANVVLLKPFDEVIWDRTTDDFGVDYVAPSQVVVDCLTGNGRMPAEGEALLEWMMQDENAWRWPAIVDI
jgi:hypothetical protein